MTAQTTASGTEISEISFKHKIAVLKFEVTLPDGIVPKYITLSTQDDAGIAISQKASDESNVTTAKQLTGQPHRCAVSWMKFLNAARN